MSNPPKFYDLLRTDRDDAARARVLDNCLPNQPADIQIYCEDALHLLKDQGLGENQAKAFVCTFIIFYHMKVDEQDKWREHGQYLRAQYEWACLRELM